nr:MAG TPA: hypothetical protein [Caudoviricetes sp.]
MKRRNISDNDFIYRRLSRVRLLCQSLSVKNTLKMDIDFSGLNTFSTPSKLTDLAQQKPGKYKKKGCEKPSFLLISNCI